MKYDFSKSYVRKVLSGGLEFLGSAFVWAETPQGYEHWYSISRGKTLLTAEDRAFLESLLEDSE